MATWPSVPRYSAWCWSQFPSDQRLDLRPGPEIVEAGIDHVYFCLVECLLRGEHVYDGGGPKAVALLLHSKVLAGSDDAGPGDLDPGVGRSQFGKPELEVSRHPEPGIGCVCLGHVPIGFTLGDGELPVKPIKEIPAEAEAYLTLVQEVVVIALTPAPVGGSRERQSWPIRRSGRAYR